MSKMGPILILEDDKEDQELLQDVFKELEVLNRLIFFTNGQSVIEYLASTPDQPFIILSDINLPVMNGLQLRERIDQDDYLRRKSIPFVFFTTSNDQRAIDLAYELTVQGYFTKGNTFGELKESIRMILHYWTICKHPNSV